MIPVSQLELSSFTYTITFFVNSLPSYLEILLVIDVLLHEPLNPPSFYFCLDLHTLQTLYSYQSYITCF